MDPTRIDFVLYTPTTPTADKNSNCGFDCYYWRPIRRNLIDEFDEVASPRRSIIRNLMDEFDEVASPRRSIKRRLEAPASVPGRGAPKRRRRRRRY